MSSIALCTVKAPIAQITTMIGAMIENGTRRIAAKSGTHVSTMMRPAMLPEIHAGDQAPHEILLLDEKERARAASPR